MTRNLHTGISGRRRPKKNGLERVKHAASILAFLKGRKDDGAKTATKKTTTAKKSTTAAKKPAAKKTTIAKKTTTKKAADK